MRSEAGLVTSSRRAAALAGLHFALLLASCAAVPQRVGRELSLYERVDASLSARTDLEALGQPAPQMKQVEWMLGSWNIEAQVFATPTTPAHVDHGTAQISVVNGGTWLQMADAYPQGTQDLGFLTYNLVTRRWVSVALDSTGNSVVTTGPAWEDDRLVLSAAVEIVGISAMLRQTVTRAGPDRFSVLNEEQLPSGRWIKLDEYRYQRTAAKHQGETGPWH